MLLTPTPDLGILTDKTKSTQAIIISTAVILYGLLYVFRKDGTIFLERTLGEPELNSIWSALKPICVVPVMYRLILVAVKINFPSVNCNKFFTAQRPVAIAAISIAILNTIRIKLNTNTHTNTLKESKLFEVAAAANYFVYSLVGTLMFIELTTKNHAGIVTQLT